MKRVMRSSRGPLVLVLTAVLICGAVWTGAETVDLMDLRRQTGATLEWDPWSQMGLLSNRGITVAFRVGLPWAVVDYDERLDIGPVTRDSASIRFTDDGAERIAALLDPPRPEGTAPRVAAIMIDPGHGGKDPGTNYEHRFGSRRVRVLEKDIVLDIGKKLHAMLTQGFPEKRVLITRTEDVFVVLEERPGMANHSLPDEPDINLFVSIHANAGFTPTASGFEVWVLPKEHERDVLAAETASSDDGDTQPILNAMLDEQIGRETVVLANEILDGLDAHVGDRSRNRGMWERDFAVVRHARMPAVLVEVGFVTNPAEARRMTQPAYLNDLTRGIYDGISGFITWFESSSPGSAQ